MRVFLSYHTPDRDLATALKNAIVSALPHADVFLDQSHLRHGYNWQPALYEGIENSDAFLTLVGNKLGNWQTAEYYAAHDKKISRPKDFVLLPIIIADRQKGPVPNLPGLSQLHWVECTEPTAPDVLAKIVDALSGHDIPAPPKPWMLINPYRGLTALEEQDSDFFFGREAETEQAVGALARETRKIVALVGNSGVGKSSLVQAGVIASLKRGRFANGADWPEPLRDSREWAYVTFRPGDDPVRNLATAFVSLWFPGSTDTAKYKKIAEWSDHLYGAGTLGELLDATRERFREQGMAAPKRAFVYVDQCEELYSRSSEQATLKVSQLLADAATSTDFALMLSQRSDYYGSFQANLPLFTRSTVIDVTQLNADRLVRVLREPTTRLGVTFYPKELPEQLVDAAGAQPGALALLADIMIEVWDRMQQRAADGVIKPLEDAQILDIEKPLARRADRFMAQNPEDRPVIERLFSLRLVKILEVGNPIRRRVYERDCSKAEWAVLNAMSETQWRLVVTGSEHELAFAEVAHDILLSKWPALKTLIARERQFLLWRTDTEREFNRWLETWLNADDIPADENARRSFNLRVFERQEIARGNRELLHGSRLEAAADALANRADDIEPHIRQFIARSAEFAQQSEAPVRAIASLDRSGQPPRAFVSYSRADFDAVMRMVSALESAGIDAYIDHADIVAGEAWQERLGSFISEADVVIFVMSPDSLSSQTCDWELRQAERHEKRIIPFAVRPSAKAQIPAQLAGLDYIRLESFGGADAFPKAMAVLAHVVKADVAWLREQSRLSELASRWQTDGRASDRVLSPADMAYARQWIQTAPAHERPADIALIKEFLAASEEEDRRRPSAMAKLDARLKRLRILLWFAVFALALATTLAMLGWWERLARLFE